MRHAFRETATLWRDENLGGMELFHGTYTRHVFSPHFHRTYVIEMVEQGVDVFQCGEAVYRAPAGSVIVFNPFEVHTGQPSGPRPLVYRSMYPTTEQLAALTGGAEHAPHFPEKVIYDPALYECLRNAHAALEGGRDLLRGRELLGHALCEAIRRHARPCDRACSLAPDGVCRARSFMDEAYAERVTNQALTELAGMSQFHMIRAFRRATGLTPHEYLVNVRVEHARRMLAAGAPIARTARQTGFFDQSHLTRHFKRITGVTPGQYRQLA